VTDSASTPESNMSVSDLVTVRTLPPYIIYYAPITITNSQNTATPAPFQQMIQISESSFSGYIEYNNNFANFEFFYKNNTIIPAWIESNNSGVLTTWINLPKGITASNSITIYLGFAGANNLLSSSGTTGIGEAPQLSSTYGQYDDGASVFNTYLNFVGTSLPSSFTASASSDGTVRINNGLTLGTGTSDQPSWAYILSTATYSPQIVEFYMSGVPTSPGGYGGVSTDWGYSSSTSPGPQAQGPNYNNNFANLIGGAIWSASGGFQYQLWNDNTEVSSSGGALNTGLYGTYINPLMFYYNYATELSSSTTVSSNNYLLLGISSAGSHAGSPASETIQVDWFRTRAYPPGGSMPSVSFGSVQS